MADIQEVVLKQAKCKGTNMAQMFCMSPSCKHPSPVCTEANCNCEQSHRSCMHRCPVSILNYCVDKKIEGYRPIVEQVSSWVDERIKQLLKLQQYLKNNTKKRNFGLNQIQRQFVNNVNEEKCEEITSGKTKKVIASLESDPNYSEMSQAITEKLIQHSLPFNSIIELVKIYQSPDWFSSKKQKQQSHEKDVEFDSQKTEGNIKKKQKNQTLKKETVDKVSKLKTVSKHQQENIKKTEASASKAVEAKQQIKQPEENKLSDTLIEVIAQSAKKQTIIKSSLIKDSIIMQHDPKNRPGKKQWNLVVFKPELSTNQQTLHGFTITINKSSLNKNMMLFGFCHFQILRANNFIWTGPEDKSSYIMLATNGSTYSALNPAMNLKKQLSFTNGVYYLEYNNVSRQASFTHNSESKKPYHTTLKISPNNDPIYFCVSLLEPGDEIEIKYEKKKEQTPAIKE